jgi:hypothetical protein
VSRTTAPLAMVAVPLAEQLFRDQFQAGAGAAFRDQLLVGGESGGPATLAKLEETAAVMIERVVGHAQDTLEELNIAQFSEGGHGHSGGGGSGGHSGGGGDGSDHRRWGEGAEANAHEEVGGDPPSPINCRPPEVHLI